jgi:hypothetical protein
MISSTIDRIVVSPSSLIGRHGGDRSPDQNTLNLHPHMGEAFVDMMVPPARYRPNPQGITCNGPP